MSEIERFVCLSSSFGRDFAKNIGKKLANRISYQIRMFHRGSKSISARGFGPTGPYPRGVQIRCDSGTRFGSINIKTTLNFRTNEVNYHANNYSLISF